MDNPCPNFATNVCAGPPSDGNAGCLGQSAIAVCQFERSLQACRARSPAEQSADDGYTTETDPDGTVQVTDGSTATVNSTGQLAATSEGD